MTEARVEEIYAILGTIHIPLDHEASGKGPSYIQGKIQEILIASEKVADLNGEVQKAYFAAISACDRLEAERGAGLSILVQSDAVKNLEGWTGKEREARATQLLNAERIRRIQEEAQAAGRPVPEPETIPGIEHAIGEARAHKALLQGLRRVVEDRTKHLKQADHAVRHLFRTMEFSARLSGVAQRPAEPRKAPTPNPLAGTTDWAELSAGDVDER